MTRKYFHGQTAEEIKKEYRILAKKLHPDNHGNVEEFKAMQNEFTALYEELKDIHVNASGEQYRSTGEYQTNQTAQEFMDMINELLKYQDIEIEICGRWIWISGSTWNHTALLKQLHFRFSANKKAWYFHTEPYRKKSKKKMSLDDIRKMYGSVKVDGTAADGSNVATA